MARESNLGTPRTTAAGGQKSTRTQTYWVPSSQSESVQSTSVGPLLIKFTVLSTTVDWPYRAIVNTDTRLLCTDTWLCPERSEVISA